MKSRPYMWLIFLGLLVTIFGPFILSNGENYKNLQSGNNNTVVNKVENGGNVTVAEKIENYYSDEKNPEYLNPRNELTSTFSGDELVQAYFALGNSGKYRDTCSLLNKKACDSENGESVQNFSNYWQKLDGGYKILEIYKSQKQPENGENVFCVKYEYNLKQDLNPGITQEILQFRVVKREDGIEEISSRVCEKKTKGGVEKKCPISTKNLYCL